MNRKGLVDKKKSTEERLSVSKVVEEQLKPIAAYEF